MSAPLKDAVLVTIVCERVLQNRIAELLKNIGVTGYTVVEAQGAGKHGRRIADMASFLTNIELKTVVSQEDSDKLLSELKQYQADHALIAFRHKVEALME